MVRAGEWFVHRSNQPLIGVLLGLAIALGLAAPAHCATATQIDSSVERAVNYLYSVQDQKDGLWEVAKPTQAAGYFSKDGMHYGGLTAVATYALLDAGESPQSPKLLKAIQFLKGLETKDVYVLGVRAQVWTFLPKNEMTLALIARDTGKIAQSMETSGVAAGMFHYAKGYPHVWVRPYDHSISQYGVLGLWAGAQNGIEVPDAVWNLMNKAWRAQQSASGGWPYIPGAPNYGEGEDTISMTCAGVASLLIISDYVNASVSAAHDDPNIDKGLQWLADNFKQHFENPAQYGRDGMVRYYSLYGIERIGVAGGYKYFGNINWFSYGSDFLLHTQNPNGSWGGGGDIYGNNIANIPDTCFGILFFIHGRAPVVMNKLSYTSTQSKETFIWNERPRDVANLVRWVGKEVEAPLNWHVVTLDAPLPELHDAHILYLSGDKPLDFSDADVAKLRQFVQEGGMILANANSASPGFVTSARTLAEKMFPNYEFRELPAKHPIYVNQQFPRDTFKTKPSVLGQSNGVRELFLIIPDGDASKAWQTHATHSDLFPLGSDIIQYAMDRKGLNEGTTLRHYVRDPLAVENIVPDSNIKATRSFSLARLSYEGNWDPEPAGWSRLAAILHNQFKLDIKPQTVKLGDQALGAAPPPPIVRSPEELRKAALKRIPPDDLMATNGDQDKLNGLIDRESRKILAEDAAAPPVAASGFRLAHLTGTSRFHLTDAQRLEIKNFISSGGTLVVDAAGGSAEFASAAEDELSKIFGDDAVKAALATPLPPSDPLYTMRSAPIDTISYRTFARAQLGMLKSPRVCGIVQDGRVVAYYSREDLSAGIVGEEIDGIYGYSPATATAIMRNIVLAANK
jgi:hypothetical protein